MVTDRRHANGATIKTNARAYFFFERPEWHNFKIKEIAYALSYINRFTGHAGAYSVAQHSVLVSELVPTELALEGLLHDAAEAYVGDVASPLKRLIADAYKPIELAVEAALFAQHGLRFPLPPEIKHADLVMLLTEHRDYMDHDPRDGEHWPDVAAMPRRFFGLLPYRFKWPAWYARYRFIKRYKELTRDPR